MKNIDKYLANLAVANVLLHNLHWNVVGFNFKGVHEYLEGLYDDLFEKFDEVAEYQKMKDVFPKASLKEYLEVASVKELESKEYPEKNAIEEALKLYKELKSSSKEVLDGAECFALSNMMEDHIAEYTKQIWFMESMLK